MDTNIDWLFDEVYSIKRKGQDNLYFLSDWDVSGKSGVEFQTLIENVYSKAAKESAKYNYAYEQFEIKNGILKLAQAQASLKIEEYQLTITPSSTLSVHLCIQSLKLLNVKRVLVVTPVYFSVHDTLSTSGLSVIYYHLEDCNNLSIDFAELESIIQEQYVEAIFVTDPIYSAGTEIPNSDIEQLATLCNNHNLYLLFDYSLGGLNWQKKDCFIANYEKLNIVRKSRKHVFIDTLSKRLLLNGIKFSLVIGDKNIVDKIDLSAESVYGGLSAAQCYLLKALYHKKVQQVIDDICLDNIKSFKDNFNLLQSFLIGTEYQLPQTDSGYFTLLNHNEYKIKDIDSKSFCLSLLREQQLICITKDRFSYFDNNNFGFRINLNKNIDSLFLGLRKCIGIDYSRFYKR